MIAIREVELKLQLDMANIDMLVAAPFLDNVKMQEQVQTSVYFDTPEHAVRKTGLSLRVRTVGKQRIQTLKAESMSAAALFARPEWEMPIRKNQPVIGGRGNPLPTLITLATCAGLHQSFGSWSPVRHTIWKRTVRR